MLFGHYSSSNIIETNMYKIFHALDFKHSNYYCALSDTKKFSCILFIIYLLFVYVCQLHEFMCVTCMKRLVETISVIRSPRTEVTGNCELLCSFWEQKLGPLQEHQELLTTESSLKPLSLILSHSLPLLYLFDMAII